MNSAQGKRANGTDARDVRWPVALLLLVLAWLFGVLVRCYWIYFASHTDGFMWNGLPIPNNRDSFLFGCILQKAWLGMHTQNSMVPGVMQHGMITALPYMLGWVLPLNIPATMLLMPVVVAPLLAVPILLIGRLYGQTLVGFLAAAVGVVTHSFYNRTLAGYYDTDMFSVTVPMLALLFMLAAVRRQSVAWLLATSLTLLIYPLFYGPGLPVIYGLAVTFGLYAALFCRQSGFAWHAIILLGLAATCAQGFRGSTLPQTAWLAGCGLVAVLVVHWCLVKGWIHGRVRAALCVASVGLFAVVAAPHEAILSRAMQMRAAQRPESEPQRGDTARQPEQERTDYQFLNTLSTVRETKAVPLSTVARRISGASWSAVLALVGYVLWSWKHREMVLGLPFVGLGLFALAGGLRFTIFAVPLAALSSVWLLARAGQLVHGWGRAPVPWTAAGRRPGRKAASGQDRGPSSGNRFVERMVGHSLFPTACCALGTLALLVPNLQWIGAYKIPVLLRHDDVAALDMLRQQADPEDMVITWWDYGSAVWFYSGCQTLNSPASNQSPDNFIVSQILSTSSFQQAANLCLMAAEYHGRMRGNKAVIRKLLRDRHQRQETPREFLESAASATFQLPPQSRETFLFLPAELLRMYPAIRRFSNRDLLTGKPGRRSVYTLATGRREGLRLALTVNRQVVRIDGRARTSTIGGRPFALHALHLTGYSKTGQLLVRTITFDRHAPYHVVSLPDPGVFLVLDAESYASMLVQLFVFENEDSSRFEAVDLNRTSKLYRVRR